MATPTPTPTQTPTITPEFWPTPTPYPTLENPLVLTYPATNPILVEAAEESVQMWNLADKDGVLDNGMVLVVVFVVIMVVIRVQQQLASLKEDD